MAVVLHTTHGDLPVLLRYVECPIASVNFLGLCASGYYDGCSFYRHIPGVLLQTGDPTGSGKGGASIFAQLPAASAESGTTDTATEEEEAASAFPPHLTAPGPRRYFEDEGFGTTTHAARGTLSMAHRGTKPNTNASQFFVLTAPQPSFDGMYTAFGNVDLSGLYDATTGRVLGADSGVAGETGDAVLAALEEAAADVDEKNIVQQRDLVKIVRTTVLYNPFAEGAVKL